MLRVLMSKKIKWSESVRLFYSNKSEFHQTTSRVSEKELLDLDFLPEKPQKPICHAAHIDIEDLIPEPVKPDAPEPGDCCESGCINCVNDIYLDKLDEYVEKLQKFRRQQEILKNK